MADVADRILIVEDETSLADTIQYNLEREGYSSRVAPDGAARSNGSGRNRPSLVILDLMLPEVSGLDVCRIIRAESDVPIIILTAKDAEADKVTGLELGADDYVTKPFSVRELVSRVRAQLRRARIRPDDCRPTCSPADRWRWTSPATRSAVGGEAGRFPPKEFELLETFLRRKGRLLTRDFLIEEVWGSDYFGDTKTLDVHVKRLRKKIEADPHDPVHLVTVRGLGYKFVD